MKTRLRTNPTADGAADSDMTTMTALSLHDGDSRQVGLFRDTRVTDPANETDAAFERSGRRFKLVPGQLGGRGSQREGRFRAWQARVACPDNGGGAQCTTRVFKIDDDTPQLGELSGSRSRRLFRFAQDQNAAIQKAVASGDAQAAVMAALANPWSPKVTTSQAAAALSVPENVAKVTALITRAVATPEQLKTLPPPPSMIQLPPPAPGPAPVQAGTSSPVAPAGGGSPSSSSSSSQQQAPGVGAAGPILDAITQSTGVPTRPYVPSGLVAPNDADVQSMSGSPASSGGPAGFLDGDVQLPIFGPVSKKVAGGAALLLLALAARRFMRAQ